MENGIFRRKNRPVPTVHAAGHDWKPSRVQPAFLALRDFSVFGSLLQVARVARARKNGQRGKGARQREDQQDDRGDQHADEE